MRRYNLKANLNTIDKNILLSPNHKGVLGALFPGVKRLTGAPNMSRLRMSGAISPPYMPPLRA
jgi:hypothetical protein